MLAILRQLIACCQYIQLTAGARSSNPNGTCRRANSFQFSGISARLVSCLLESCTRARSIHCSCFLLKIKFACNPLPFVYMHRALDYRIPSSLVFPSEEAKFPELTREIYFSSAVSFASHFFLIAGTHGVDSIQWRRSYLNSEQVVCFIFSHAQGFKPFRAESGCTASAQSHRHGWFPHIHDSRPAGHWEDPHCLRMR